jgi:hypothetical protein
MSMIRMRDKMMELEVGEVVRSTGTEIVEGRKGGVFVCLTWETSEGEGVDVVMTRKDALDLVEDLCQVVDSRGITWATEQQ